MLPIVIRNLMQILVYNLMFLVLFFLKCIVSYGFVILQFTISKQHITNMLDLPNENQILNTK